MWTERVGEVAALNDGAILKVSRAWQSISTFFLILRVCYFSMFLVTGARLTSWGIRPMSLLYLVSLAELGHANSMSTFAAGASYSVH